MTLTELSPLICVRIQNYISRFRFKNIGGRPRAQVRCSQDSAAEPLGAASRPRHIVHSRPVPETTNPESYRFAKFGDLGSVPSPLPNRSNALRSSSC